MSNTKSFHLRWNNHLSNLRTLLEYLYNEQSFVDVTLSCTDGLLRAHKLVLSACSPYFEQIFRENPCKHPTVILKGISLRELQLIIEYMYVGSVDVPEDELQSLLHTASELHVKGLVQANTENEDDFSFDGRNAKPQSSTFPNAEIDARPQPYSITGEPVCENQQYGAGKASEEMNATIKMENEPIKVEEDLMCGIMDMALVNMDEGNGAMQQRVGGGVVEYQQQLEKMPNGNHNGEVGPLRCTICSRFFINKQNLRRHMQTHSGEKPHRCHLCNLSFLRLSHLQRHHRVHTGERPFACTQCDKQFSRSDKLKQHVAVHHNGQPPAARQQSRRGRPRKPLAPVPVPMSNSISIQEQNSLPNLSNNLVISNPLETLNNSSGIMQLNQTPGTIATYHVLEPVYDNSISHLQ